MPRNERLMTEEISPETITLVIIVRLYLSGDLPDCKYLLVFLARCLEGFPLVEDKEHLLPPTLLSLCQSMTKSCQNRRLNQAKIEINEPENLAVNVIQLKILHVLWSINSADQLLIVVNETYDFVAKRFSISYDGPRKMSQRSFLGRFSQRLAVSMKLLHFDESSVLFTNFCLYRQSTSDLLEKLKDMYKDKAESISNISFSTNPNIHGSLTNDDTSQSTDSKDEEFYKKLNANLESIGTSQNSGNDPLIHTVTLPYMESLVETQIQLLQRHGTPTPQVLRQMFTRMASSKFMGSNSDGTYQGEISSVHYLTYLETLHSGDYRGAFDSLHRYFDYMVSKGSRYFYHFALVSKASLHQYFGENEKALDSIEEAIAVARENKDNSTLVYILSWLFDFVRKNPSLWNNRTFIQIKNDLQLLDSLVRKSLSVSILLAAISYRSESEYLMNNNACFAKYYESLFKSNYLTINDHISSFIGACHVTSDLWKLVGFPHLENLYTKMGISYAKIHGTASDLLEFKIRERREGNYLGGFEEQDLFPSGISGDFKHRPLHYKFLFQSVEYSLKKGRIRLAAEILNSLPGFDDLDQDSYLEKLRLTALISSAHGNYADALTALDRQIVGFSNQSRPLQSHLIHFLNLNITKAQILIQSGVPFRALSLILQQMEIAKVLGFLPLLSKGCSSLIQVLTQAGSSLDAYALALSIIPLIFCLNDCSVISSTFYELAYLCLQFFREDKIPTFITKKELFKQCLNFLSLSISGFKKSGDLKGLSKCFELESELSLKNFFPRDTQNASLLAEFSTHSRKGLEILKTRISEQSGHGYLERDS